MAATGEVRDWSVTREKVDEAVRRIVDAADPVRIVAFGSRARGDERADSDLDLAVIVEGPEEEASRRVPAGVLSGLRLEADLVVVSTTKFDQHRPFLNSVFHHIDHEGVVLYDREHPESARPDALHLGRGRRVDAGVAVA